MAKWVKLVLNVVIVGIMAYGILTIEPVTACAEKCNIVKASLENNVVTISCDAKVRYGISYYAGKPVTINTYKNTYKVPASANPVKVWVCDENGNFSDVITLKNTSEVATNKQTLNVESGKVAKKMTAADKIKDAKTASEKTLANYAKDPDQWVRAAVAENTSSKKTLRKLAKDSSLTVKQAVVFNRQAVKDSKTLKILVKSNNNEIGQIAKYYLKKLNK